LGPKTNINEGFSTALTGSLVQITVPALSAMWNCRYFLYCRSEAYFTQITKKNF